MISSSLVQVWLSEQPEQCKQMRGGMLNRLLVLVSPPTSRIVELSENKPPKTCIGGSWPKIRVCVRAREHREAVVCLYNQALTQ